MPFNVDYIFCLTMPVVFRAMCHVLYTTVVSSRVSALICCIVYPNPLIFYKTGTLRHSYKNKTN